MCNVLLYKLVSLTEDPDVCVGSVAKSQTLWIESPDSSLVEFKRVIMGC